MFVACMFRFMAGEGGGVCVGGNDRRKEWGGSQDGGGESYLIIGDLLIHETIWGQ